MVSCVTVPRLFVQSSLTLSEPQSEWLLQDSLVLQHSSKDTTNACHVLRDWLSHICMSSQLPWDTCQTTVCEQSTLPQPTAKPPCACSTKFHNSSYSNINKSMSSLTREKLLFPEVVPPFQINKILTRPAFNNKCLARLKENNLKHWLSNCGITFMFLWFLGPKELIE